MKDKLEILESDGMYHIYIRANGNELLFISDDNYRYFLEKFAQYIHPLAEVFSYCLMPNHFHFLVRIKPQEVVEKLILQNQKNLQGFQNSEIDMYAQQQRPDRFPKPVRSQDDISSFLSLQFSNFFNAYSKAYNKQNNRKGSLFIRPYKRKRIDSEQYLRKVIHYIHYNPIEAGLVSTPDDWKYSSYKAIINLALKTNVLREEVVGFFEDLSNFIYCHKLPPDETGIDFR